MCKYLYERHWYVLARNPKARTLVEVVDNRVTGATECLSVPKWKSCVPWQYQDLMFGCDLLSVSYIQISMVNIDIYFEAFPPTMLSHSDRSEILFKLNLLTHSSFQHAMQRCQSLRLWSDSYNFQPKILLFPLFLPQITTFVMIFSLISNNNYDEISGRSN